MQRIAEFTAKCEKYVGTESGGMDQAISIMGEKGLAKLVHFKPVRSTSAPCRSPTAYCLFCHRTYQHGSLSESVWVSPRNSSTRATDAGLSRQEFLRGGCTCAPMHIPSMQHNGTQWLRQEFAEQS